jgi:hypothetical protein
VLHGFEDILSKVVMKASEEEFLFAKLCHVIMGSCGVAQLIEALTMFGAAGLLL